MDHSSMLGILGLAMCKVNALSSGASINCSRIYISDLSSLTCSEGWRPGLWINGYLYKDTDTEQGLSVPFLAGQQKWQWLCGILKGMILFFFRDVFTKDTDCELLQISSPNHPVSQSRGILMPSLRLTDLTKIPVISSRVKRQNDGGEKRQNDGRASSWSLPPNPVTV